MIKRILVPLDGSDLAKHVLPYVTDLGKTLRAELYLIQVVSDVPATTVAAWPAAGTLLNPEILVEDLEAEAEAARNYLAALAGELRAGGLDAQWEVIRGAPGPAIVDFAHSGGFDLVAMSTHGRSGLSRMIFGSVAEHVVREAGIPVLLLRPREHARQ